METRNAPLFNEEDRISMLPDNLIHHILSFTDMKYAVQTSVLSRRWRYIWTSLPTLNFDDGLFVSLETEDVEIEEVHGFINFVDRVLILRESSDIQRFQLVCDAIDSDMINSHSQNMINSHLHTWILAAVRRNVQELFFRRFMDAHTFEIPHCLFTCKSLTKLEIVISSNNYEVFLPGTISLPVLKFLRLDSLSFGDQRSTNMLVSQCPALETLIIESSNFNNVNLNISSLKLIKHFELKCYDRQSNGKVEFNAPNLTFFRCRDYVFKDYSLENLSSLVTADILMDVTTNDLVPERYPSELLAEKKELYAQRMMKILRALHNVKVLILSPWFLEVLSRAPEILENQPTHFLNLRHLKLGTWFSRDCMDAIIYLLNISPNIESLCLQINQKHLSIPPNPMYPFCNEINFDSGSGEDFWGTGLSFPCMLYHLKFVEIQELLGCVNELKFLEILLKNAMVLEKVVLLCSYSEQDSRLRGRRMKKFCDKLLSFQRASASIAILSRF